MIIREKIEKFEHLTLIKKASFSKYSSGRKIKEELDAKNVPYVVLKPVDFGLKRVDKILPLLEPHFN